MGIIALAMSRPPGRVVPRDANILSGSNENTLFTFLTPAGKVNRVFRVQFSKLDGKEKKDENTGGYENPMDPAVT